jgi:hypothetical protein
MLIKESKLRQIIRSVIRESKLPYRDSDDYRKPLLEPRPGEVSLEPSPMSLRPDTFIPPLTNSSPERIRAALNQNLYYGQTMQDACDIVWQYENGNVPPTQGCRVANACQYDEATGWGYYWGPGSKPNHDNHENWLRSQYL